MIISLRWRWGCLARRLDGVLLTLEFARDAICAIGESDPRFGSGWTSSARRRAVALMRHHRPCHSTRRRETRRRSLPRSGRLPAAATRTRPRPRSTGEERPDRPRLASAETLFQARRAQPGLRAPDLNLASTTASPPTMPARPCRSANRGAGMQCRRDGFP